MIIKRELSGSGGTCPGPGIGTSVGYYRGQDSVPWSRGDIHVSPSVQLMPESLKTPLEEQGEFAVYIQMVYAPPSLVSLFCA